MLAIPNLRKKIVSLLLLALATLLVSCATKKDTRLVSDQDEREDSLIPWNKQEKWETQGQGQLSQIAQERR